MESHALQVLQDSQRTAAALDEEAQQQEQEAEALRQQLLCLRSKTAVQRATLDAAQQLLQQTQQHVARMETTVQQEEQAAEALLAKQADVKAQRDQLRTMGREQTIAASRELDKESSEVRQQVQQLRKLFQDWKGTGAPK